MIKNMGTVDKTLRASIAFIIAVLYVNGQIAGPAAIVLGVLALIFLVTTAVGTCPLYLPFGISTRDKSPT